jgi:hypothetical protein
MSTTRKPAIAGTPAHRPGSADPMRTVTLNRLGERMVGLTRPADRLTELTPGGPPYRMIWCGLRAEIPGTPPDERYFADEVQPQGTDAAGRLVWEAVPDGLTQIVVHNLAEADARTHAIPAGTVVRAEERLDRSDPPNLVYMIHVQAATTATRLARVLSHDGTSYTVQPVVRQPTGFADEGSPITGVPNVGELWNEEKGYLMGPAAYDRIVPLVETPAGWTIVLHPPRLV